MSAITKRLEMEIHDARSGDKDLWTVHVKILEQAHSHIAALESQLAARNQAAEAVGVLERWLTDGSKEIDISRTGDVREVLLCEHHGATTAKYGKADSLIEAVLKAGGEDG